jgi:hypothetical protein
MRVLGLVSLSLIIAVATYGFAEANSTNSSGLMRAGYGVKSSFDVSNINYTLDINDPSKISGVDFEIEELDVYLIAGVSATEKSEVYWADNCDGDGMYWTCTFIESIDVLTADWLHVSSVQ